MKSRIHFVVKPEPIPQHGQDEQALCGEIIHHAQPVVIVPDAILVSVGIIADTFGSKMCRRCQMLEPSEGYIYFLANEEFVQNLRRSPDFAEAI
jgi:hypothetical protein